MGDGDDDSATDAPQAVVEIDASASAGLGSDVALPLSGGLGLGPLEISLAVSVVVAAAFASGRRITAESSGAPQYIKRASYQIMKVCMAGCHACSNECIARCARMRVTHDSLFNESLPRHAAQIFTLPTYGKVASIIIFTVPLVLLGGEKEQSLGTTTLSR